MLPQAPVIRTIRGSLYVQIERLVLLRVLVIVIVIKIVVLIRVDDRQVALGFAVGVELACFTFLFGGPVGTHGVSPFGSK